MDEDDRARLAKLERDFRRLTDVLADGRLSLGEDRRFGPRLELMAEYGTTRRSEERQLFRIYQSHRDAEYVFERLARMERALSDVCDVLATHRGGWFAAGGYAYEPIRIYVGGFDPETFRDLEFLVRQLASLIGYEELIFPAPEYGSIFRRAWARIRRTASKNEPIIEESIAAAIDQPRAHRDNVDASTERSLAEAVKLRAEALLAEAQARQADAQARNLDAEAIKKLAEAAATLTVTAERLPDGMILQVGPLIVARTDGGPTYARVLSDKQRSEWEQDPGAQNEPARAVERIRRLRPPKGEDPK